jgi:hypothetical protein
LTGFADYYSVSYPLALKRLRALKVEKKRYSARLRMMRAILDNDFLYKALFGE